MATAGQSRQQKKAFLESFRRLGNVSAAASEHDINRSTVYTWLDRDDKFAEAFRAAESEAVDYMEREAWRRAVEGTRKPVYQSGNLVGHVQEYSDTLMIFLLKARDPKKYRETLKHEHAGNDGGPLTIRVVYGDDGTDGALAEANPGSGSVS